MPSAAHADLQFGWQLDHIIVVADPRRSSQISAPNSLDSDSGLVGPNGRPGITSHQASRCRMPLSKASMVGCTMSCWRGMGVRFTEGGENVNDSRGAAADRIFPDRSDDRSAAGG